ncbi:hypothetical protein IAQ61_008931 [Plenodomus lingam]|uniref:uncharacterized protein n=1 Tax=Leptosphaeria maculans TaxID=5022 RepID=UPI00331C732C|nr:hypothetical protein IAQ61_008931 [Plenodomus lingam]
MDPFGHFCIGPSCERPWFGKEEAESVQSRFDRGPWPSLPAFGIVSLIDWQAIVVSPLFYQVRFPEFISLGDDYGLGFEIAALREEMEEIDDDDQAIVGFKHEQTMMGKAYEAASGFKNKNVFKSLRLPLLFRQLFLRCGEAWEEGIAPLRACLIAIADVCNEAGFSGDCACRFSKQEIKKYEQAFQDYQDHHRIYELAREYPGTDADGWIAPDEDFEEKQERNKELLEIFIAHCAEYGKSAEEMRKIRPY